jgi:hypothetical protein
VPPSGSIQGGLSNVARGLLRHHLVISRMGGRIRRRLVVTQVPGTTAFVSYAGSPATLLHVSTNALRAFTMLSTRAIHKQKVVYKMSKYIVELVHKEIFLWVVHKQ